MNKFVFVSIFALPFVSCNTITKEAFSDKEVVKSYAKTASYVATLEIINSYDNNVEKKKALEVKAILENIKKFSFTEVPTKDSLKALIIEKFPKEPQYESLAITIANIYESSIKGKDTSKADYFLSVLNEVIDGAIEGCKKFE